MTEQGGSASRDAKKRKRSGPRSRTSDYLGVTRYKRTGRWEAHIWDSSEPVGRKGKQLHLGSFPSARPAALAYDRAAFKMRSGSADFNFPATDYSQDSFIKACNPCTTLHAGLTTHFGCMAQAPLAASNTAVALHAFAEMKALLWPQSYGQLPKQAFILKLRSWAQSLDREDSQDGEDNANGGANNGGSGNGAAHAAEQAAAAQPLQRQRRRAAGMRVKLEPSSDDSDEEEEGEEEEEDEEEDQDEQGEGPDSSEEPLALQQQQHLKQEHAAAGGWPTPTRRSARMAQRQLAATSSAALPSTLLAAPHRQAAPLAGHPLSAAAAAHSLAPAPGEGRALLYEPAYEEARQPEHAAGEGSAPMRQQAPYLEGAELGASSGDMLQQPYTRAHQAPAFSAASPGYEAAPVWHSAAYQQQRQQAPQVMHSRAQSGPQELYQRQLSAGRSQRSGYGVPVQQHCLEYDQGPAQAQRTSAAEEHATLHEQRMTAAERAMRGIFRGTVARGFAPAAAQPPGGYQRGGAFSHAPPQQQPRVHAQAGVARSSPAGLLGGGAVQGHQPASYGAYQQQGLAPRQPLQRSYSHSGMLGYQAYALPGSMSHQRSLPANFELLETHSATVHPSAPSAPNRMQAQSHRVLQAVSIHGSPQHFQDSASARACAQQQQVHASNAQSARPTAYAYSHPHPQQLPGSYLSSPAGPAWQQQQQAAPVTPASSPRHLPPGRSLASSAEQLSADPWARQQDPQHAASPAAAQPSNQWASSEAALPAPQEGGSQEEQVLLISGGSHAQRHEVGAGLLASVAEAHAPSSQQDPAGFGPQDVNKACTTADNLVSSDHTGSMTDAAGSE